MGTEEHKALAPKTLSLVVLSMSSTRGLAEDESGTWMTETAKSMGHIVLSHQVLKDDKEIINHSVKNVIESLKPDVILMTGGTGITPSDVTIEAVRCMFRKEIPAFATLFALESQKQIGAAALLSRAAAGVIRNTAVFCMPGSIKACKLACENIIFPELTHLVKHIHD